MSETDRIFENLQELFKTLSGELGRDCAKLDVQVRDGIRTIRLIPQNPHAAEIFAIIPDRFSKGLTLWAGKGTCFEIPFDNNRYTNLPFIEEVRSICSAIMTGTLEESVLFDEEEVLKGTGSIKLPQSSARTTVHWRQVYFRPFRKKQRKHFCYEPYCSTDRIKTFLTA